MVADETHIFDRLQIQVYGIHGFVFDILTTIDHINFISIDNYIEHDQMQSIFDEQTTKIFDVSIEHDDIQCPNVYLKEVNDHCKNSLISLIKRNQNIDIKKKHRINGAFIYNQYNHFVLLKSFTISSSVRSIFSRINSDKYHLK